MRNARKLVFSQHSCHIFFQPSTSQGHCVLLQAKQKVDKMMENLKELNSNTMVFKFFFLISMRFPQKGGKWLILFPSEEKIKT